MQNQPLLSISILVSNRIDTIRKCMESIKPLLTQIPSELVVIDTVGEATDGSIAIVKEYTDKIYRFEWCNDFAAARNFGMEKCSGKWFMFLDDDEWFEDVSEIIEFFKKGDWENYYTGYYFIRNYLNDGSYVKGILERMIRLTPSTKFVGKVHEHFNEQYAPKKQFNCYVHHYGYVYETEEARAAKQARNISILKKEIEENGLTPQRAAQMAQELLGREETVEEGFQYCMESIAEINKQNKINNSCSQWLLTATVRCLAGRNQNERMLKQAEYIDTYPLTQMAKLVLAASAVVAAAEENNKELTAKYCELYIQNWDWLQTHTEEALQQSNMDFPVFYEEKKYHEMVHLAAVVANQTGQFRQANQYWKRLPWDKKDFNKIPYVRDLNWTIEGLKWQEKEEKKKEIIDLLDVLQEANSLFTLQNGQARQEFSTQMQQVAIMAGTKIDELSGEGTEEVAMLEQYCELIWQYCNNIEANVPEIISEMHTIVKKVKESYSQR